MNMAIAIESKSTHGFATRWINLNGRSFEVSTTDFLKRYQSLCSEDEPVHVAETRRDRFIAEFCQPINFKNPQSR